MQLINNKVRLVELADRLGVTTAALRKQAAKPGGLGEHSEKLGNRQTGDILLSIDSVLRFLDWAKGKARKIPVDVICNVEEEIRWLQKH